MCSANKDSFGLFSVDGLSLRHQQSGIALEKSCPLRIKLDESNSRSKCLDNGKLIYVKLSLFYNLSPNPFHWVHFRSQTAVVSKWQNLWALPQDASGLKGLIVFPRCCCFDASEHCPRRSIWELWSWTRGWSQGSLVYPHMRCGWQVMESEHNLVFTNYMEYPSIFMSERHSCSRKKGHFFWLIPTDLAPCIHTRCSGADNYSGKCHCVCCARKQLSGLVLPDIMETNVHAGSDLLQTCTTRQNINKLGRCRSLTYVLLATYEQLSLYLCVCMLYPTERKKHNLCNYI